MKPFNIVLVAPEIPQNTGSIGRLCVSTNARLHLVKPLGFVLDDKHLKRAGMDYWPHLDLTIYENWEEFLEKNNHPQCVWYSAVRDTGFRRNFMLNTKIISFLFRWRGNLSEA